VISENLREFHGLPVQDFKEPGAIKNLSAVAPRLRCEYDDEHTLSDYVNMLLAEPGVGGLKALVLGLWTEDGDASEANPREAIELLVSNKAQLPALEALFIGDIISEENEISWIRNGDMSPLWSAFPNLTTFGVRGTNGLRLGKINHPRLKTLTVETGGLPAAVTREALDANAPIEHFELWFGVDEYGLSTGIADLEALFAGRLFPNLKSLALRNADFADAIAQRLATAPVLDRIGCCRAGCLRETGTPEGAGDPPPLHERSNAQQTGCCDQPDL
jgi:hypothetical protein